jgi:hypothetical protein
MSWVDEMNEPERLVDDFQAATGLHSEVQPASVSVSRLDRGHIERRRRLSEGCARQKSQKTHQSSRSCHSLASLMHYNYTLARSIRWE